MRRDDRWRRRAITSALALCALAACGPGVSENVSVETGFELECEHELIRLDGLIALRSNDVTFPEYQLIEARALRAAAADLCFESQFNLALELIDEAAVILGKS
ncbi:MAG: hypothetical protein IH969_03120 [Candidatus Krumholzibacteriota bacterium]|nr:hypothetical protein [Candidatus Krumholzibacteriota bacterium]